LPPRELPPTARTIRIEDIDRGVKSYFDRQVDASVTSPGGDRRKVPVKLSSGERWVAAADRQGIRDRDGRLILPIIQIRRGPLDLTAGATALGANVPRLQLARLVSEKTSDLANLDQSRPISQRRLRDSAVYDVYTIPFPCSTKVVYKVRIQTQYQHQMNEIIERFVSRLEFFDVPTFVISLVNDNREGPIKLGDGQTELAPTVDSEYSARTPLSDYYVVGYVQGSLNDEGNQEEFTDQERIIQTQLEFHVPAVLMLDPAGSRPAVQRERTAFSVSLLDEEVVVVDNAADADLIFDTPNGASEWIRRQK
jgi:hypothetical protein